MKNLQKHVICLFNKVPTWGKEGKRFGSSLYLILVFTKQQSLRMIPHISDFFTTL